MAHFIDFNVGGFKTGSIDGLSGIFVGQNLQYGWRSSSKVNLANRTVTGDYNRIEGINSRVDDPDILDSWIQKPLPFANMQPPSPALASLYQSRTKRLHQARRSHRERRTD